MNTVGQHIKQLRLDHHMTQQELANRLNVTNKTISKWETGRNLPDIEMVNAIAKIFDISVDELLNERKKLRLKTKRLFCICFIELVVFVFMLLFISYQQSISYYHFVLSFALPNIFILLVSIITSYLVSYYNIWIKALKSMCYVCLGFYNMIFILTLLPLGLAIFTIPAPSFSFYVIVIVTGIIIGI